MVQLSPDTRIDGSWDGCSGYHYSDSVIYGFSHTHLSGTGVSDYGDMHFMPVQRARAFVPEQYRAKFNHENEKVSAGYYRVTLDNQIRVELSATARAGMQRISYPDARQYLSIDLSHRDELISHQIKVIDKQTLALSRVSKAWAEEQHCYAWVEFSAPFEQVTALGGKQISLQFSLPPGAPLLIRTGLSFTGLEGARANLQAELNHWDFDLVKHQAEDMWEHELRKMQVYDADEHKLINFYTAMYHLMIHPNLATDVDGRYRGGDLLVHQATEHQQYTVFSLWDTFRAAHPLLTLIDSKRTRDFVRSMLDFYQQSGRLPVWELAANETDCMIGYHSVSVIADAAAKGITNFDMLLALKAMRHSAERDELGLAALKNRWQISADDEHESVSKQLEYAYDDWCIAQMAQLLGDTATEKEYRTRASYWQNLFDTQSGFMRPKKNGGWLQPFDPYEVNNHYTEGNAWQYAFFVPHQLHQLIALHGGAAAFEARLDALFSASNQTTGRQQADITGLIGQYAHGNEPSHHMAFLYQYVERPDKTQLLVDSILRNFYTNQPDGLIGNEDCGQMSAWYLMASIGLYQLAPGSPWFNQFAPHVDSVIIQLENGKNIRISRHAEGPDHRYPEALWFNGQKEDVLLMRSYDELMAGPEMRFVNTNQADACMPVAIMMGSLETPEADFFVNPLIEASSQVFRDQLEIRLLHPHPQAKLYYSTDGRAPEIGRNLYTGPFSIHSSTTVAVIAQLPEKGLQSATIEGRFYKLPANWQISLGSKTHPQYSANGAESLIDGIRGSENWRQGDWLGFWGEDMVATLDLGNLQPISSIRLGFLQDSRAWILFPKQLEIYGSVDGQRYHKIEVLRHKIHPMDEQVQLLELACHLAKQPEYRYLRLVAKNYGRLPTKHLSAGEAAYVFVDEIRVVGSGKSEE